PRADAVEPSPPGATAAPGAAAPAGVGSAAVALAPAGSVQPVGFFPHAWYLAVLKERIFARWAPPSEFFGAGVVAALVSFRIDRAGRISGVAVKESSGHARFDRSALAAIQGLGQVPPLPEQYAEETLDVVIRFQNE
ncbi:MAG TPA: energy transducer TonB, partial [bacterium]